MNVYVFFDLLVIVGKIYGLWLLIGIGKFKDLEEICLVIEVVGVQIVIVVICCINIGQNLGELNLLDVLLLECFIILFNIVGCYIVEDVVCMCCLVCELLDGYNLIKLEVLGDQKILYLDVMQIFKVVEQLVKDGFEVMVYIFDDLILVKCLEEIGCVVVMLLVVLIGLGLGIQNKYNLLQIIEDVKVLIIVDVGVGIVLDVVIVMELGCDGVLMNIVIVGVCSLVLMVSVMCKVVEVGCEVFLVGCILCKCYVSVFLLVDGLIG